MMEHIIRIYKKSKQYHDHAYPIADIVVTGPLHCNLKTFAKKHGGDYAEYVEKEDEEVYC